MVAFTDAMTMSFPPQHTPTILDYLNAYCDINHMLGKISKGEKKKKVTRKEEEEKKTENDTSTFYITIAALNIKTKIIINNPWNGTDYKLYIKVIIAKYAYSFGRESMCISV